MLAIIKCTQCRKDKTADAYKAPWQFRSKVCNYCKNYNKITPAEVKCFNGKDKKVSCLQCGDDFVGRTNVRICGSCKISRDYKTDQYIQLVTMGL